MKALALLVSSLAVSIIVYLAVFSWVHKPLTIDVIDEMMRTKRTIAERSSPPRLFVLAGSNGRFSHRCQTMETLVGRPCINLSVAAGIGLDYVLSEYDTLFTGGDTIYMPLEYSQYSISGADMWRGPENALIYRLRRDLWSELGWSRVARAAASFDLPFLIQGLAEMSLRHVGFQRRVGLGTLTPNGDESGHSRVHGEEYALAIRMTTWATPDPQQLQRVSDAKHVITAFLARMRTRCVQVIGGLPTTFDDQPVTEKLVGVLNHFYREAGSEFLALDNNSQYPRQCFYDTSDHLNEECQKEHSRRLAVALRKQLENRDPNICDHTAGGAM